MSENYIDVNLTDVRVGDEVKVDGIGERVDTGGAIDVYAGIWWYVRALLGEHRVTLGADCIAGFRRSSIVAARRKVDPSEPKVGEWKCSDIGGREYPKGQVHGPDGIHCGWCRVYRSTGWSKDQRAGERRGVK